MKIYEKHAKNNVRWSVIRKEETKGSC